MQRSRYIVFQDHYTSIALPATINDVPVHSMCCAPCSTSGTEADQKAEAAAAALESGNAKVVRCRLRRFESLETNVESAWFQRLKL